MARAATLLDPCRACPVRCGAHRLGGEAGECGAALRIPVTSAFPHFGEERPLSGHQGSGTIFFGGCNLHCVCCQNSDISQGSAGRHQLLDPPGLVEAMLALAERDCHNVNLVSIR